MSLPVPDPLLLATVRARTAALRALVQSLHAALTTDPYAPLPDAGALAAAVSARDEALRAFGADMARACVADGSAPAQAAPPVPAPPVAAVPEAASADAPAASAPAAPAPASAPAAPAPAVRAEPPVVPAAAPQPAGPPASAQSIHALRAFLHAGGAVRLGPVAAPATEAPPAPDAWQTLLVRLGPPVRLTDEPKARAAQAAIQSALDRRGIWAQGPGTAQAVLQYITARMREVDAFRPPLGNHAFYFERIATAAKELGGPAPKGLHPKDLPPGGSWHDATKNAWDHLAREAAARAGQSAPALPLASAADVAAQRRREHLAAVREAVLGDDPARLVAVIHAALDAGLANTDSNLLREVETEASALLDPETGLRPAFRTALKNWVDDETSLDADEAGSSKAGFTADAALRSRTEGRRALIVGGDERSHARERIEAAFAFAEVEWERGWTPARVGATRASIAAGSHDVVILLVRFVSHRTSGPILEAAKGAGVPVAWVEAGYGLPQIEKALASALLPPQAR